MITSEDEIIKIKFREKIKEDGRKFKWFQKKYLPEVNYNTFMWQIGYTPLPANVKEAIEKYMKNVDISE